MQNYSIDWIKLSICVASVICYIVLLVVFLVKIHNAKKQVPNEKGIPRESKSFKFTIILAVLLILLPIIMPMETYLIAIICATGILGEYIALKDRLCELKDLCSK